MHLFIRQKIIPDGLLKFHLLLWYVLFSVSKKMYSVSFSQVRIIAGQI